MFGRRSYRKHCGGGTLQRWTTDNTGDKDVTRMVVPDKTPNTGSLKRSHLYLKGSYLYKPPPSLKTCFNETLEGPLPETVPERDKRSGCYKYTVSIFVITRRKT